MADVINRITTSNKLHVAMFPWLAFGHMIPYLELAKLIAQKGHIVSFISTPRNIDRLPKLPPSFSLINFIKLPLPDHIPNLPLNAEATTDLPYNKVQFLKTAYDQLKQPLTRFLQCSNPDWILHDFAAYWVGSLGSDLGIKTSFFSIFTPQFVGSLGNPEDEYRVKPEDFTVPPRWVPFQTNVAFKYFEIVRIFDGVEVNESGISDLNRFRLSIQNCDILAIRGSSEFDPEWFKLIGELYGKPVFPVGQLPTTEVDSGEETDMWRSTKQWLDKQKKGSVVYVAFGSEAKPSQDELNQIATGLEQSELPFFWVFRSRLGEYDPEPIGLPDGFEERTMGRGIVCKSWAPQLKILAHDSVGGFLTHSGWSSVVEAIQFENVLIMLTFLADQGPNARVLEDKMMGYSVPRNELDGSFTSESVAESLRLMMVKEEGGKYRERIKEVKGLFVDREKQEKVVEDFLEHLKTHKNAKKVNNIV